MNRFKIISTFNKFAFVTQINEMVEMIFKRSSLVWYIIRIHFVYISEKLLHSEYFPSVLLFFMLCLFFPFYPPNKYAWSVRQFEWDNACFPISLCTLSIHATNHTTQFAVIPRSVNYILKILKACGNIRFQVQNRIIRVSVNWAFATTSTSNYWVGKGVREKIQMTWNILLELVSGEMWFE